MEASAARQGGIDGGRVVIAIGAILLFISLFLDWFGSPSGPGDQATSAWTAFEIVDLLLALIAVATIAAVVEPFLSRTTRLPPAIAAAAGPAALVLVLVSIINKPPLFQTVGVEIEVGAWLALAGAAIMCAGALLALNRVSLVVTPRERPAAARTHETQTQPLPPDPKP